MLIVTLRGMTTPVPAPVDGVLFDFHSTLVDQGDAAEWLRRAWQRARRDGEPADVLGAEVADGLVAWADRIWERARELDPDSRRDLDPASHREVYDLLLHDAPSLDTDLTDALYVTLLDTWVPYDDTLPVLRVLRAAGIRTALVSNVGLDVRAVLDRGGLSELLDAVVLSYEVGVVKPHPGIFAAALERIGVAAEHALMVGDSWQDDGGAAQLGVRTLVLPRTTGPLHGLGAVLRLAGAG